MKKATIIFLVLFACVVHSMSIHAAPHFATPSDLTSDIPWLNYSTYTSLSQVEQVFNDARAAENSQLNAGTPVIPFMNLDGSFTLAAWTALSQSERGLWLTNNERVARNLPPLAGIDPAIVTVAQNYANSLATLNTGLNHNLGGTTPSSRMIAGLPTGCYHTIYRSENLAWNSTPSFIFPVELSIYSWIYDDSTSTWGHRRASLFDGPPDGSSGLNVVDDHGTPGNELLIGFGLAQGSASNGTSGNGQYVVYNMYDPELGCSNVATPDSKAFMDFGDAPSSYGVASHKHSLLFIGAQRSLETATSTKDNNDDGVTFSTLIQGRTASLTAFVTGSPSNLDIWIDYNRNGNFTDAGERITPSTGYAITTPGNNTVTFTVPNNISFGSTWARVRVSTAGGLGPTDTNIVGGEVEDYSVTLVEDKTTLAITETIAPTTPIKLSDTLTYTINVKNTGLVSTSPTLTNSFVGLTNVSCTATTTPYGYSTTVGVIGTYVVNPLTDCQDALGATTATFNKTSDSNNSSPIECRVNVPADAIITEYDVKASWQPVSCSPSTCFSNTVDQLQVVSPADQTFTYPAPGAGTTGIKTMTVNQTGLNTPATGIWKIRLSEKSLTNNGHTLKTPFEITLKGYLFGPLTTTSITAGNLLTGAAHTDLAAQAEITYTCSAQPTATTACGNAQISNQTNATASNVTGTVSSTLLNSNFDISSCNADYSDLPTSYGVAWHLLPSSGSNPHLGSNIDSDSDWTSENDNTSDDGVSGVAGQKWSAGTVASGKGGSLKFDVQGCDATCYLYTWIDWEGDGSFAGNEVLVNTPVSNGIVTKTFDIPSGTNVLSASFKYRVRIVGTSGALSGLRRLPGLARPLLASANGAVSGGEVEDGTIAFDPTAVTVTAMTAQTFQPRVWIVCSVVFLMALIAGWWIWWPRQSTISK
jgi:hypothetical protein